MVTRAKRNNATSLRPVDELETARRILAEADSIVSFSGAGLSAESGIPTFREAQHGYWAKHDPYRLASPDGFAADPKLVVDWYNHRRNILSAAVPNPAHRALGGRSDLIHITQNVDNLLERARASAVLHLHGRIWIDRCNRSCGYEEAVDLAAPPDRRDCPRCGSPMRPAVVWFGESLPDAVWRESTVAAANADVLLVVGTSAVVYPAAGLIDVARQGGAVIVEVNLEAASPGAHISLTGPAGELVPRLLNP